MTDGNIVSSLEVLIHANPPLLLRAGYNGLRVISAQHAWEWGMIIRDEDKFDLIMPRRWIDITGSHITDGWRLANLAILSTIFIRPGITLVSRTSKCRSSCL